MDRGCSTSTRGQPQIRPGRTSRPGLPLGAVQRAEPPAIRFAGLDCRRGRRRNHHLHTAGQPPDAVRAPAGFLISLLPPGSTTLAIALCASDMMQASEAYAGFIESSTRMSPSTSSPCANPSLGGHTPFCAYEPVRARPAIENAQPHPRPNWPPYGPLSKAGGQQL